MDSTPYSILLNKGFVFLKLYLLACLVGTVFLLILADRREIEGILGRVEWSTLIFFSALFIVMEVSLFNVTPSPLSCLRKLLFIMAGVSRLGLLEVSF